MTSKRVFAFLLSAALIFATVPSPATAAWDSVGTPKVKHVLLISIDGMHAVDFYNCTHGISSIKGGSPYCPNLAALGQTGINYVGTISSRPSDFFPGMAALATGGTPKSTGAYSSAYYDVAYDRSLDPPA